MQIHAFSGFYSQDMVATRSAGILAVLTEAYPQMTWDDVLQWAHENGLDEWTPNIETDDAQPNNVRLVGSDGFINFDDRFPWPDNGQSLFNDWKNGYAIGKLPPIHTASPAVQDAFLSSQPAPAPAQQDSMTEWDFFQQSNPDTTLQPVATPAPSQPASYTQSQPAPVQTPAINPVSYQKPDDTKKEGSSSMLLIVGGLIVAYMLIKKGKK